MYVKISKAKHISWWVDQENFIDVRWNSIKNCAQRQGRWLINRSKTLNEVKPVENKSKNLQIFVEISFVQKGTLPSYKLQDREYE